MYVIKLQARSLVTRFSFTCLNILIPLHRGEAHLSFPSATLGPTERECICIKLKSSSFLLKSRKLPMASFSLLPLFSLIHSTSSTRAPPKQHRVIQHVRINPNFSQNPMKRSPKIKNKKSRTPHFYFYSE